MQGNQFIVWLSVPNPPKKPTKVPYDPVNNTYINAHDPAQWMSYNDAAALVALYDVDGGVAFILTAADPYWCVDLDECRIDDGWSEFAISVVNRFPGAMVEVSVNQSGLHIWGTGSPPAPHKTRHSAAPGLEVYSRGRFIALGTGATGDAETAHPEALAQLIADYLPGDPVDLSAWTTTPVPQWAGPADDDELLSRMLSMIPGMAIMTGRASFTDLWDADAAALTRTYPSVTEGETYDASSADAALCAHLAWWTGKDCDRIKRLFERSALMRDKWKDRPNYQATTICGAVAKIGDEVYRQPGADMVAPVAGVETITGGVLRSGGMQLLDPSQQVEYFKGCAYVINKHKIMLPNGVLLNQGQFNAVYGGYDFIIDFANGKSAKHAWEAFTESRAITFPQVNDTCFKPDLAAGAIINFEGKTLVNIYQPIIIPSVEGDATPFLNLIDKLFPDQRDKEIILSYAAACVQYPGQKFQWAPLVQGVEGNGKTFIASCISHGVGLCYSHTPNAQDISNKFNAWMDQTIFAIVEEVYTRDRFECTEALKPMITNVRLESQVKGGDQLTRENCVKFWLTSNHRDAIAKTRNDRRYSVFYTPQQSYEDMVRDGMTGNYFPELYRWLNADGAAIVSNFLKTYQIKPLFNPAGNCQRAPSTTSTEAAIVESLGNVEQEIMEAVSECRAGFMGGYISSGALTDLLEEKRYKIGPKRRRMIVEELGYVVHPGFGNENPKRDVGVEEGHRRVTLYIKADHPSVLVKGVQNIVADYRAKQNYDRAAVLVNTQR